MRAPVKEVVEKALKLDEHDEPRSLKSFSRASKSRTSRWGPIGSTSPQQSNSALAHGMGLGFRLAAVKL